MMGPFWLLVAVHSSGYFISAGSLHFSTMWKRGWTSAGTTTSPSGQTSWYLPATQTGLTESKKSYQDENLQRIQKSLFFVTDACLVWAPCWLRLPWRTSRKRGWRWELLSPSGDLGIGLVWDNPTGPDRTDFLVPLLKFSSNWTRLSMRGPQLFSGWYQMKSWPQKDRNGKINGSKKAYDLWRQQDGTISMRGTPT